MEPVDLGTESAVERIYRDHGPRLWRSLAAFTGDPDIASDAVAEAFAQALCRGDELRDLLAWIWRVAFRIASGELQRRGSLRSEPSDIPGPVDTKAIEMVDLLRRLPTNQRAALILGYYADLPAAEVAALMGVSVATVRVHQHRGRRHLRKLLEVDDD
ncbi:MAG: RNA polymerase sigma factor [Actinomycetota bacterium]